MVRIGDWVSFRARRPPRTTRQDVQMIQTTSQPVVCWGSILAAKNWQRVVSHSPSGISTRTVLCFAEAKAAAAAAVASGDAAPVKGSRAHVVDTSKAADAPSVSATTHSPSPLAATAVKHNVDTHASASVPEVATVTAAAAPKTWASTLLRAPVAPAPAPAPVTAPQSHVPVAAPITHAAPASIVPAPVAPVAATAPATKAESKVATKAAETIDTTSKPASTFSYRDAVKKVVVPSSKPKVLGGEEGGVSTSVVAPSPALGDTVSGTMVILPSGGALGASPVTSPDATTNSQSDSVWAALSKTIAKNAGDSHPGSLHATATLGSSLGLSAHLSGLTAPTHDAGAAIRKIVLNADAAEFVPTFVSKA